MRKDACIGQLRGVRASPCRHLRLGTAGDGDNLLGMEMDAYAFLDTPLNAHGDPVPWTDMTIRRSEGAEWLITGHASGKARDTTQIPTSLHAFGRSSPGRGVR